MTQYDAVHDDYPDEPWPWLIHEATLEIARRLRRSDTVFEWGSGGSTIWLAHRAGFVWSTEHVESYYSQISALVEKEHLHNVSLMHISRETGNYPYDVYSLGGLKDDSVDFVLVDGRARVRCVESAIPMLKTGGTLVLDNAERPEYRAAWVMLSGWPCVVYSGDIGGHQYDMTAMFTKPSIVYAKDVLHRTMLEWMSDNAEVWEA